jgi:RHS repeat-associated protein
LNYLLYDKDFNILDMGFQPATGHNVKQKIGFPTIKVKEAGYIFVYLSYESESNLYVQFDDLKITHRRTNIVQYNEYYPFGLQTAASWTRAEKVGNRFLFNAGSELSARTGWYDMPLRSYDPVIGRMLQVDPMATTYASWTGYNYALNKPTMVNDPTGGTAEEREDEFDYDALNAAFAALSAASAESADFNGYGSWSNNSSRRIGIGSGNHWTDGIKYDDWHPNTGSNIYRSFLAASKRDPSLMENGGLWFKRVDVRTLVDYQDFAVEDGVATIIGRTRIIWGYQIAKQAGPGPVIPLGMWVDPSSLRLKRIALAWYGAARVNEEIGILKIPYRGYVRLHLNATVNFLFSANGIKKDQAQYLVATALDRARVGIMQDLYANPGLSSTTAANDFKEYFAIHLMTLTYGSEVKSYSFPGAPTFNVQYQWFPSLPPGMLQRGR